MDFGPKAFVYRISNTSFTPGPDNDCLCGNRECYNGMSDLSPCFYGEFIYLPWITDNYIPFGVEYTCPCAALHFMLNYLLLLKRI